jgi:outer membrane lipoprotein-sorting protein
MRANGIGWTLGLAGGVLLAAVAVEAQGKKTANFTVTAIHSGQGVQLTVTSKVWITPTQARADVKHPLEGDITFLISNGSFYRLDPKTKKGVKGPLSPEFRNSKDNFSKLIGEFAFDASRPLEKAKKIRTETIAGYPCDVFTNSATKESATRSVTIWMPQKMEPRFPLKAILKDEIVKPGASVQQSITVSLSNVRVGMPISPSVFAVPPGYQVVTGKPRPPRAGK